jgi:hypothetical protein
MRDQYIKRKLKCLLVDQDSMALWAHERLCCCSLVVVVPPIIILWSYLASATFFKERIFSILGPFEGKE